MNPTKAFSGKRFLQGDWVVWMVFLSLCMVSVVEVYSASSNMTYQSGEYWRPVREHGIYLAMGFFAAWITHWVPLKYYKMFGALTLIAAYVLLLVALFGEKVNGGARWIRVASVTIQPSELAKISLVVVMAFILSHWRDGKGPAPGAIKATLIAVGAAMGLIVTENASTAIIIFAVAYFMLFYTQVRKKYLAWIAALAVGGAALAVGAAYSIPEETLDEWQESPVLHRVPTWVHRITGKHDMPADPAQYDITRNIQVTHARIAVATSHIIGKGPGNSVQRDYLPQAFSDFIYAIIIEEGGLVSGLFVMGLYLLLMWRASTIAKRCTSLFPAYLVMGLALMLTFQALLNMAVAVGAFPVTGQPLPLVSKGGTSTLVCCTYMGMILGVSRVTNKKRTARTSVPGTAPEAA